MSKFANSLIIHIFATLNSQVTNVENIQAIKQRFGIIGNDLKLNRALEKAIQVAPTDISVLITGESGVGKEALPRIIHSLSMRKHGKYIAVNCGAIPEGTIDFGFFCNDVSIISFRGIHPFLTNSHFTAFYAIAF